MLTLGLGTDKENVENLYSRLSVDGEMKGANFLFYDEEKPVGLMRLNFDGGAAVADKIRFLENVDPDDRNFFFRAILYKLSQGAPIRLRIPGERSELKRFGFELKNGNTEITTDKIVLNDCAEHRGI